MAQERAPQIQPLSPEPRRKALRGGLAILLSRVPKEAYVSTQDGNGNNHKAPNINILKHEPRRKVVTGGLAILLRRSPAISSFLNAGVSGNGHHIPGFRLLSHEPRRKTLPSGVKSLFLRKPPPQPLIIGRSEVGNEVGPKFTAMFSSSLLHFAIVFFLLAVPFWSLLPHHTENVQLPKIVYEFHEIELPSNLPAVKPPGPGGKPGKGTHPEKTPARGSSAFHRKVTVVSNPPHPDNNFQTIIQPHVNPAVKIHIKLRLPNLVLSQAVQMPHAAPPVRPAHPCARSVGPRPHGAPGASAHPAPEKNLTTPKSSLVAGHPIIRLTNVSNPTLTLYKPKRHNSGAAVLVFPGGGYSYLVIDITGTEICRWLNSIGVNCILVKYRVPNSGPYPKSAAALQDAQRAMGLVREHARAWHINPHHIGVIGFSAGGYLAAAISTNYQKRLYKPIDAADKLSCRPDFAMLIYPGYIAVAIQQMKLNPAIHVTAHTPPAFLVQAEDDPFYVQNSIDYFLALKHAGVPAQMHLFAYGGHGYGLRPTHVSILVHDVPPPHNKPLPITHWPKLAAAWMQSMGFLK